MLFDGGAHKAFHSSDARTSRCQRVHAVEADPFMAEKFREIINREVSNSDARLRFYEAALQNDKDLRSVTWKSSPSHVGRSSIVAKTSSRQTIWGDNPEMEYRDEFEVPATTIDKILAEDPPHPF